MTILSWLATAAGDYANKRIYFLQSAIVGSKKDFLSLYVWNLGEFRHMLRYIRGQNSLRSDQYCAAAVRGGHVGAGQTDPIRMDGAGRVIAPDNQRLFRCGTATTSVRAARRSQAGSFGCPLVARSNGYTLPLRLPRYHACQGAIFQHGGHCVARLAHQRLQTA